MSQVYIPYASGVDALDEMGNVGWTGLSHAYSAGKHDFGDYAVPPNDFPAILKALCSQDDETRMDATEAVRSSVWHQGTVFEVTAHMVPFLSAFAADANSPARAELLSLLVVISASAFGQAHDAEIETMRAFSSSRRWLLVARESATELFAEAVDFILGILDDEHDDFDEVQEDAFELAERLEECGLV